MKILILGGTGFVGRHIVASAQNRGHDVTLFNRGISAPTLFPDVKTIIGDRSVSHDKLQSGRWDVAIDTNARMPRIARQAAETLRDRVGHYTFISSMSAYSDLFGGVATEDSTLAAGKPEDVDDQRMETYGIRKAVCEAWIADAFGGPLLTIRPGLIVGPHDDTDRFTYWPIRIAEGGEILAPGDGSDLVSLIDVRDLADWTIAMVERREAGAFNACGPKSPLTMKAFLEDCKAVCNPTAKITWVDATFLEERNVLPWKDMPTWAPGLKPISIAKAVAAGLSPRPLRETIKATLLWAGEMQRPLKAGLDPARERTILAEWQRDHGHGGH